MKKFAILTDSTSNIPSGTIINGIKIYTVPIYIYVNNEEFKENENITIKDISKKIEEKAEFRSSQPSTSDLIKLHHQMKEDGVTHCIGIHASSSLTGTYQNSLLAADMKETDVEFFIFDSSKGAYAIEKMIYEVISFLETKKDNDWNTIKNEAEDLLEKIRLSSEMYVIPFSLKQLVKSGRVNTAQLLATALLNIKIVLAFDNEGKLLVTEKIRTDKKVKKFIESQIERAISLNKDEFVLLYTNNKEECQILIDEFTEKYSNILFKLKQTVPVVAIHTGNGTIAIYH